MSRGAVRARSCLFIELHHLLHGRVLGKCAKAFDWSEGKQPARIVWQITRLCKVPCWTASRRIAPLHLTVNGRRDLLLDLHPTSPTSSTNHGYSPHSKRVKTDLQRAFLPAVGSVDPARQSQNSHCSKYPRAAARCAGTCQLD